MITKGHDMPLKVFIPTAGIGSRLHSETKYLNKSLTQVGNKPAISHILNQFPADSEFVIALGHKGDLVREYLEIAHPELNIKYVDISPYEGEGSGLGITLLQSKEYLQSPFIFCSCDTLFKKTELSLSSNWMALVENKDINAKEYRTAQVNQGKIIKLNDKGNKLVNEEYIYTGLAGIYDYREFWNAMETSKDAINLGEIAGLQKMISLDVYVKKIQWSDIGNIDSLNRARIAYQKIGDPIILKKEDEAIWFVGKKVIKFSNNEKFISNRVLRTEYLSGYVPSIVKSGKNIYAYKKVDGLVFSEVANESLFELLLTVCTKFWRLQDLSPENLLKFRDSCLVFYRDKTKERISQFYKELNKSDNPTTINGIEMPKLEHLLSKIEWDWLANGLPSRFHGDFHFENIIFNQESNQFKFIDWRQDFAGNLEYGDIYYDLAKLLHGMIVNHEIVNNNLYEISWIDNNITFDFHQKYRMISCENYFEKWINLNGYSYKKIRILTALIFINIAPLHHHSYALFLYALGKKMLYEEIEYESNR